MKKQYTTPYITVELLASDALMGLTGSDTTGTIIEDGGGILPSDAPINAKSTFGTWEGSEEEE